jgi:predicted transcriptional regulator
MKHLECEVFALKEQGKTNAQIGEMLGLTKAQIKGLIKRHNRRADLACEPVAENQLEEIIEAIPANIRTPQEISREVDRLSQELDSLEDTLHEIDRIWDRIEKSRKAIKK